MILQIQKYVSISWIFIAFSSCIFAQSDEFDPTARGVDGARIMFYNVENLFDIYDDPTINDNEFTPKGSKSWSYYRYKEKLNHIAKTIIAVGGWEPPALIGLCEVENFQVLMDLISHTPLKKYGYQVVHENSKDRRGIDVAILFRPEKLTPIAHKSMNVSDESLVTRDILYASFSFQGKDTLHFFVNHWPSRYGGRVASESKRIKVAKVLKAKVDSIVSVYTSPKIIAMGDFNDEPADISVKQILGAKPPDNKNDSRQLYNLSYPDFRSHKGTLVYKEIDYTWFLYDQILVSGSLIESSGLLTKGKKSHIFSAEWLLKNDRPFRSYQGPIYRGGFSDHLPIYMDFYMKKD